MFNIINEKNFASALFQNTATNTAIFEYYHKHGELTGFIEQGLNVELNNNLEVLRVLLESFNDNDIESELGKMLKGID